MVSILYQDKHIIVAVKPPAVVSESTPQKDGMADLLAEQAACDYIGVLHRLDRGVGGVMVYAKTPFAAAKLSKDIAEHRISKQYLAVVHGTPSPIEGECKDLLYHDRYQNKTFVTDRKRNGVKEARLNYRVLATVKDEALGELSLVSICLFTGRTHQIRVQFSHRKHPLVGDRKYGAPKSNTETGLFCSSLSFSHPSDGRMLSFSATPTGIFERFDRSLLS